MQTIKIEYLGRCPKRVELPIPFESMSEKTGEVLCNPVGEFPVEDGERLLEISGKNGMFRRVTEKSVPEHSPYQGAIPEVFVPDRVGNDVETVKIWENKDFKTIATALAFITRNKLKREKLVPTRREDGRWALKTSQASPLPELPEVMGAVSTDVEGHKEE